MINLASFDGTEYGLNWKRTILRDDNEQHMKFNVIMRRIYYAQKQISGCGIALNTGGVRGETFLLALHELPIMVPIAFVLEFFVVGRIAKILAFTVMRPDDRPQFITYAISICICCIMCPIMSFAATLLFKENKTFGTWVQTWGMNFPMALLYQMFYCGPLVRLIFRTIFHEKKQER